MVKSKPPRTFSYKRCPDCLTTLELTATVCIACRRRVGTVDRQGRAKRPVNYIGYLAALFWVVILMGYIWFFFIRSP